MQNFDEDYEPSKYHLLTRSMVETIKGKKERATNSDAYKPTKIALISSILELGEEENDSQNGKHTQGEGKSLFMGTRAFEVLHNLLHREKNFPHP